MRKITFNDRFMLTQAVLEGRKTQARRIACDGGFLEYSLRLLYEVEVTATPVQATVYVNFGESLIAKSKYRINEKLTVAQSYHNAGIQFIPIQDKVLRGKSSKSKWDNPAKLPGWNNKLLTRADLMPHQIRIADIRIQRLQDISDENCLNEGVFLHQCSEHKSIATINDNKTEEGYRLFNTVREAYAYMIDAISGKGTWESNPYVFVYDFKLIK